MTLKALLTSVTSTEPGIWLTLHDNVKEVFHTFNGGKVYASYITCVIDTSYPRIWERAGFFSALILQHLSNDSLKGDITFDSFRREGLEVFLRGGQKIGFLIGIRPDTEKVNLLWKKLFDRHFPQPEVSIQATSTHENSNQEDYLIISIPFSSNTRQAFSNGMECFRLTQNISEESKEIDWGEEIRFYI